MMTRFPASHLSSAPCFPFGAFPVSKRFSILCSKDSKFSHLPGTMRIGKNTLPKRNLFLEAFALPITLSSAWVVESEKGCLFWLCASFGLGVSFFMQVAEVDKSFMNAVREKKKQEKNND